MTSTPAEGPAAILLDIEPDDFNACLVGEERPEAHAFAKALRRRAADVEARGGDGKAWGLLAQLFDMHFKPNDPRSPFGPMIVLQEGRSIVPDDLSPAQTDALKVLFDGCTEPEGRAWLGDILWLVRRDFPAARAAVEGYVASARRLEDPEHWVESAERLERAARLARTLGARGGLFDQVLIELQDRADRFGHDIRGYLGTRAMELLLEFRAGDCERNAQQATTAAAAAQEAGDWERCRTNLEIVLACRRRLNDAPRQRATVEAIAVTYVDQATVAEQGQDWMMVSHFLQKAIEAYRRAGGHRDKVETLHGRLLDAQARSLEQLRPMQQEIDVSEIVKAARRSVAGVPLRAALVRFARARRILDFAHLRARAEKLAQKFPLQGLMSAVLLDRRGRQKARRPPLLTDDPQQRKEALFARVVEHADLERDLAARAVLIPALEQITSEHRITKKDLMEFVERSAFVPPGREGLYAQGLLAGFEGDFVSAMHLLLPQVENSVRHLMESAGLVVTTMDENGDQQEMTLTPMLTDERLRGLLPEDVILELRTLLTDPRGPNLRNRFAHGLMEEDEFSSTRTVYAWWLAFVLCEAIRFAEPSSMPEGEESDGGARR